MINMNCTLTLLNRRYIGTISLCNKIHTTKILHHESYKLRSEQVPESSLWFTNLPKKSLTDLIRTGKRKPKGKKPLPMPKGELLIMCKNEALNHRLGTYYKKFAPVPLASKGWHSKKAVGDYFIILPKSANTSFPSPDNLKVNEIFKDKTDLNSFATLGINKELVERLKNAGYHHPTHIQWDAIPVLLSGKNVLITGETGCGKTLAYVVPILEHIMKWKSKINLQLNSPLALIVVPTRELAFQIGNVLSSITTGSGITHKVVLADETKKFLLNFNDSNLEYVDIVVTTLGVICKFTYHKVYNLGKCLHVVLDEADTLMDDSFSTKLHVLLKRCTFIPDEIENDRVPRGARLSLVSATVPKEVEQMLENMLPDGSLQKIKTKYLHKIPPHIQQNFIRCKKSEKHLKMLDLVKKELANNKAIILFSNVTETCNWLAHFFRENGIKCARLNKKMNLTERVTELENFRNGVVNVLTCTDIASRGQDIPRVNHVINYEFPMYMADYVHRCGRTGRIGNNSVCEVTSFISRIREIPLLNQVELSARTDRELSGVNNNIKRLLRLKNSNI